MVSLQFRLVLECFVLCCGNVCYCTCVCVRVCVRVRSCSHHCCSSYCQCVWHLCNVLVILYKFCAFILPLDCRFRRCIISFYSLCSVQFSSVNLSVIKDGTLHSIGLHLDVYSFEREHRKQRHYKQLAKYLPPTHRHTHCLCSSFQAHKCICTKFCSVLIISIKRKSLWWKSIIHFEISYQMKHKIVFYAEQDQSLRLPCYLVTVIFFYSACQ